MTCGRRIGVWLDERQLAIACCWRPVGHPWECHDRVRDLRWTPGHGVDATGTRYLIDLADVSSDLLAELDGSSPRR